MSRQLPQPTPQEIMNRLNEIEHNAELRDRRIGWLTLMAVGAAFVAAGVAYLYHSWGTLIGVGCVGALIGLLGVGYNWRTE